MSVTWRISEAASLALHVMLLLAKEEGDQVLSTQRIASRLAASEWHLAKVLQRLAKAGLVRSCRGPRGGYQLAREAKGVTLLDVYQAIDGPLAASDCLLHEPMCDDERCILGPLLKQFNREMDARLRNTTLLQVAGIRLKPEN